MEDNMTGKFNCSTELVKKIIERVMTAAESDKSVKVNDFLKETVKNEKTIEDIKNKVNLYMAGFTKLGRMLNQDAEAENRLPQASHDHSDCGLHTLTNLVIGRISAELCMQEEEKRSYTAKDGRQVKQSFDYKCRLPQEIQDEIKKCIGEMKEGLTTNKENELFHNFGIFNPNEFEKVFSAARKEHIMPSDNFKNLSATDKVAVKGNMTRLATDYSQRTGKIEFSYSQMEHYFDKALAELRNEQAKLKSGSDGSMADK